MLYHYMPSKKKYNGQWTNRKVNPQKTRETHFTYLAVSTHFEQYPGQIGKCKKTWNTFSSKNIPKNPLKTSPSFWCIQVAFMHSTLQKTQTILAALRPLRVEGSSRKNQVWWLVNLPPIQRTPPEIAGLIKSFKHFFVEGGTLEGGRLTSHKITYIQKVVFSVYYTWMWKENIDTCQRLNKPSL